MPALTAMDSIGFFVRYLNAEFLQGKDKPILFMNHPKTHTSSIAITTSTVSKLSRPKSFEKCDCPEI